jgi:hypothetical protein
MQTDGDAFVAHVAEQAQHIRDMYNKAKQDKDTLRINCLDAHLLAGTTLLRNAEEQLGNLRSAVGYNSTPDIVEAYGKIVTIAGELQHETDQADDCKGLGEVKPKPVEPKQKAAARDIDDPTDDCNTLGLANCQLRPLEPVAWASPFAPN